MRAVAWTAYGPPDVLQLRDAPKPAPKDGKVLVKIRADPFLSRYAKDMT